jgi:hypothetical protein
MGGGSCNVRDGATREVVYFFSTSNGIHINLPRTRAQYFHRPNQELGLELDQCKKDVTGERTRMFVDQEGVERQHAATGRLLQERKDWVNWFHK